MKSHHLFPHNQFFDLKIYQYGSEQCKPGYFVDVFVYDHYLFHYVSSGRGVFYIEREGVTHAYPVAQGQGLLMHPKVRASYQADETDPWHYTWIEFNGIKALNMVNLSGLTEEQPVYNSINLTESEAMLNALNYIIINPTRSPVELMGHFYIFMSYFISSCANKNMDITVSMQDNYVKKAVNFIEANYQLDISIKEIAEHCNIHRSYLSRIFKVALDTTPWDFLMRCRIKVACDLLINTRLSVGEISNKVGYPNQLNFSRAFKRETRRSPQKFREKHNIAKRSQNISM